LPNALADVAGLLIPGNINLNNRPVVHNPDGSISTVRSITITDNQGRAILIPTVVNGRVVSNDEAINHYRQTGEHLGVFSNEPAANAYAQNLHQQQAKQYLPKQGPPGASMTIQGGQAPQSEIDARMKAMQADILRGRVAPLARQTDMTGNEGPLNITPRSLPMERK
jgi:hypothetical protein